MSINLCTKAIYWSHTSHTRDSTETI